MADSSLTEFVQGVYRDYKWRSLWRLEEYRPGGRVGPYVLRETPDYVPDIAELYRRHGISAFGPHRITGTRGLLLGRKRGPTDQYRPMIDRPMLFQDFASLVPSEESILQFVREHGEIGQLQTVLGRTDGCFLLAGQGVAETLDTWTHAIAVMRDALHLLKVAERAATGEKDAKDALKRMIFLGVVGRSGIHPDVPAQSIVYAPPWIPEDGKNLAEAEAGGVSSFLLDLRLQRFGHLIPALENRNLVLAAKGCVQHIVNEEIKQSVGSGVVYSENTGDFELRLVPKTLLGAMWLQLAHVFTGDRKYGICKHCRRWFEIGYIDCEAKTRRSTREYCSDRCHDAFNNQVKKQRRERTRPSITLEAN